MQSVGFNESNADLLRQGLINLAHTEEIKESIKSPHGVKYIIDGTIQTPDGVYINIRTVWIIDKGQTNPRFVTAYPI